LASRQALRKLDVTSDLNGPRCGPSSQLQRAVWELQMKRLRVITRVLAAVVLALGARAIADGLSPAIAVTMAILIMLLAASLGLARQGRMLEPSSSDPMRHQTPNPRP
jgi:hypothetical protein